MDAEIVPRMRFFQRRLRRSACHAPRTGRALVAATLRRHSSLFAAPQPTPDVLRQDSRTIPIRAPQELPPPRPCALDSPATAAIPANAAETTTYAAPPPSRSAQPIALH